MMGWAQTQTVVDGGGKALPTTVVVKPYTTYQNYIISGSEQFTSNGLAVPGLKILHCTFTGVTGPCIFIATYALASAAAAAAPSSNIEIGWCTMTKCTGSQYYWWLQNVSGYNIHDCYIGNGTGTADGGNFYADNSSGTITNMRYDNLYGKFMRLWPASNSTTTISNVIGINSTKYSAMEIQQVSGFSSNFNVYVDNCTFGNLLLNGVPTGAITIYAPANPSINLYFGSKKPNIVFNTSEGGLLDDQGNLMKVGAVDAPKNTNWNTVNAYYTTMAAAGFASDSAVHLPDGTTWNGTTVTPPHVGPTANAGVNFTDTITNAITLNGSTSTASTGSIISTYAWSQVSGPSMVPITTPTTAITGVTGFGIGTYKFQLIVTDNTGATGTANVSVTVVLPAPCSTPTPCPPVPVTIKSVLITHTDGTTQTVN